MKLQLKVGDCVGRWAERSKYLTDGDQRFLGALSELTNSIEAGMKVEAKRSRAIGAGLIVLVLMSVIAYTSDRVTKSDQISFGLFLLAPVLASFVAGVLETRRKFLVGLSLSLPAFLVPLIELCAQTFYYYGAWPQHPEFYYDVLISAAVSIPGVVYLCMSGAAFACTLARMSKFPQQCSPGAKLYWGA